MRGYRQNPLLASLLTTVQIETTVGPIHDQIVLPEGLFKMDLGCFCAQGRIYRKSDLQKIRTQNNKRHNSKLNCPSDTTIWNTKKRKSAYTSSTGNVP